MSFFREMAKTLNLLIDNTDFRTAVKAPYAAYFVDNETNIYADNKIVYSEKEIDFYLYHEKDDFYTELVVDNYFSSKGIVFEKENTWIEKDKLTETRYTFNFNKGEVL